VFGTQEVGRHATRARSRPALSHAQATRAIWALIAFGTVARVAVGLGSDGFAFERHGYELLRSALTSHPLHVYEIVNRGTLHYPYPPGYLPWIWFAGTIAPGGWHPFRSIVALPGVVADGALAWVVQDALRRRGATPAVRLGATALIALGPSFAIISGYHGLFDSVAILPAVLAILLWDRLPAQGAGLRNRALVCGLLIGAGGTIKTVPLLMLLPLLPWTRSPREAIVLVGSALGVLALSLVPFYLADHDVLHDLSKYGGIPGLGGLTLAIQPDLARNWLIAPTRPSGVTLWVIHHQKLVNGAVVAALAAFLWRTRPGPVRGAALVWLATWALGAGFFFQYLVWGLPFLILAGWLQATMLLELVLLLPTLIFYETPWHAEGIVVVFASVMLVVWVAWLGGLAALGRAFVRAADRGPGGWWPWAIQR
jgi:hypothetical protein